MNYLFYFVVWIWRLVLLLLLAFNLRLYVTSPLADSDALPPSLMMQLASNRAAIQSGADHEMQKYFPEGYYFCHVLHGLTWVEAALRKPRLKTQALSEAQLCWDSLDSAHGRAPFPKELPPDHGMFYAAWKADLSAGIALLDADNPGQIIKLQRQCDLIATALDRAKTPFLASYHSSVWPCDSFPAIHAMAIHDHLQGTDRYHKTIDAWLQGVKSRLTDRTKLVSHMADPIDGAPTSPARATSQVIMLRFLADIDPQFGTQQYERFRQHFLTTFVGIPCVLEYPSGVSGSGDVDSGPLIFGRSISATVLMMGVAQIYGDRPLAAAISQAGEAVGVPWTWNGKKSYAFGLLPVGEIIVAYSHVARPWLPQAEFDFPDPGARVSRWWRIPVHAVTICLMLPTLWAMRRRKKVSREKPTEEDERSKGHNDRD